MLNWIRSRITPPSVEDFEAKKGYIEQQKQFNQDAIVNGLGNGTLKVGSDEWYALQKKGDKLQEQIDAYNRGMMGVLDGEKAVTREEQAKNQPGINNANSVVGREPVQPGINNANSVVGKEPIQPGINNAISTVGREQMQPGNVQTHGGTGNSNSTNHLSSIDLEISQKLDEIVNGQDLGNNEKSALYEELRQLETSKQYLAVSGLDLVEYQQLRNQVSNTYGDLCYMSMAEKIKFANSSAGAAYFNSLETIKNLMTPQENAVYRLIIFGTENPYTVKGDGSIEVNIPDLSDSYSSYWETHEKPDDYIVQDYIIHGNDLTVANLKPEYQNLMNQKYVDPESGLELYLPNLSIFNLVKNTHKQYEGYIGKDIDPYTNLISLFTKGELRSGDNILVEFAKTFEGKMGYERGSDNLANKADCSGFMRGLFEMFYGYKNPIGVETSGMATDAENGEVEKLVIGPGMSENGKDSTAFIGEKDKAIEAVLDFCDDLEPGDMILFDLGDRNDEYLGNVNHVVMYAGRDSDTGEHMIVESIDPNGKALYRPINDLVFKTKWRRRLPVFAVSYLTDEQQQSLIIP